MKKLWSVLVAALFGMLIFSMGCSPGNSLTDPVQEEILQDSETVSPGIFEPEELPLMQPLWDPFPPPPIDPPPPDTTDN